MRVSPSTDISSPIGTDRIRLRANVTYDTPSYPEEEFWIDAPASHAASATQSGNPWLIFLLPLASRLNEKLRVDLPVDPLLLEGAGELLRAWKCWHSYINVVPIEAPLREATIPLPNRGVMSFFSGGVDSFFTALWRDKPTAFAEPVTELVSVWGLDIPVSKADEIEIARKSLSLAAAQMGKPLVEVWTNARETSLKTMDWFDVFGSVLAAVGLTMESRYRRIMIPSPNSYSGQVPCGSHAATDTHFSTLWTRFSHDGAGFGRTEKLRFISGFEVPAEHLRVCWEKGAAENCGVCSKCIRTRVALEALGVRQRFKAFAQMPVEVGALRALMVDKEIELEYLREILKQTSGTASCEFHDALADCIERGSRHARKLKRLRELEYTPLIGWLFGYYKRTFVAPKTARRP
jgi:hypothetical protein